MLLSWTDGKGQFWVLLSRVEKNGGKLQQESVANLCLDDKRVLEVPDAVAVPGLPLLDASLAATASQSVSFFSVTEPVDEGSQLTHVPDAPCHRHLFLNDVGLGQIHPPLDIDKHLPQVPGRHDDCRVEFNNIALIQRNVVVSCEAPVKVVNDVSWVAASKVWHRHADLLVVVIQVDAHVLLQLLSSE